jgi:two-component system OmpR family response regulator
MSRVLVVDDEQRICRFVARALEANGFRVDVVGSGADALAASVATEYVMIVLDLVMPGLDGYEVLRRILDRTPHQRVLVLSAIGDVESKVRCLRMGAVDYLPKPFAIAELIERVKLRVDEPTAVTPP